MLLTAFFLLQFLSFSQATCPSGWTSGSLAGLPGCYFMNNLLTDTRTFAMSERYCQQLDARSHLPYFLDNSSASMTNFLNLCKTMTSMSFGLVSVTSAIWIGGFRDPLDGLIKRLNYYPFVSGVWLSGEPSGSVGNKDCVCFYMGQSGFQMCTCGTMGAYACQIFNDTAPIPPANIPYTASRTTSTSAACPSSWTLIGKLYYQVPPALSYPSVSAAAAACASLDARATLPYFTDLTQWQAFLAAISTWQMTDGRNLTIGAFQVQPGVYQMLDGAWLYSDWFTFGGQPSTLNGMDCVTMRDIEGYQWRSINCNSTAVYTVCQLNCTPTASTTLTSTSSTKLTTSSGISVTSSSTNTMAIATSTTSAFQSQTSGSSMITSTSGKMTATISTQKPAQTTVTGASTGSTFSSSLGTSGSTSTTKTPTVVSTLNSSIVAMTAAGTTSGLALSTTLGVSGSSSTPTTSPALNSPPLAMVATSASLESSTVSIGLGSSGTTGTGEISMASTSQSPPSTVVPTILTTTRLSLGANGTSSTGQTLSTDAVQASSLSTGSNVAATARDSSVSNNLSTLAQNTSTAKIKGTSVVSSLSMNGDSTSNFISTIGLVASALNSSTYSSLRTDGTSVISKTPTSVNNGTNTVQSSSVTMPTIAKVAANSSTSNSVQGITDTSSVNFSLSSIPITNGSPSTNLDQGALIAMLTTTSAFKSTNNSSGTTTAVDASSLVTPQTVKSSTMSGSSIWIGINSAVAPGSTVDAMTSAATSAAISPSTLTSANVTPTADALRSTMITANRTAMNSVFKATTMIPIASNGVNTSGTGQTTRNAMTNSLSTVVANMSIVSNIMNVVPTTNTARKSMISTSLKTNTSTMIQKQASISYTVSTSSMQTPSTNSQLTLNAGQGSNKTSPVAVTTMSATEGAGSRSTIGANKTVTMALSKPVTMSKTQMTNIVATSNVSSIGSPKPSIWSISYRNASTLFGPFSMMSQVSAKSSSTYGIRNATSSRKTVFTFPTTVQTSRTSKNSSTNYFSSNFPSTKSSNQNSSTSAISSSTVSRSRAALGSQGVPSTFEWASIARSETSDPSVMDTTTLPSDFMLQQLEITTYGIMDYEIFTSTISGESTMKDMDYGYGAKGRFLFSIQSIVVSPEPTSWLGFSFVDNEFYLNFTCLSPKCSLLAYNVNKILLFLYVNSSF